MLLRHNFSGPSTQLVTNWPKRPLDVVTGPDGRPHILEIQGYSGGCTNGCGAVIRVNVSGDTSVVADSLPDPRGIAFEASGTLLVSSNEFSRGVIRRINLSTHVSTVVWSPSAEVTYIDGIAVAGDGRIYACATLSTDPRDAIIRIDPASGAMSVLTRGGHLSLPKSLIFSSAGQLYVVNRYNDVANIGAGNGGITGIDLSTGAQTTISSGGDFAEPSDIAIADNGEFLVLQGDVLLRVRPSDGGQLVVGMRSLAGWPNGSGEPTGVEWKP